ncbi:hypothetical protein [Caulobacter sp. CCH5-E12]|uniref:hypothetical protein n=1 Tax=Caulobacter sp. CCH5-E12 TaxID=1768770 RepID=UPI000780F743|nr:hypothetical protein [Caulobacter sp. CCH5-E12]
MFPWSPLVFAIAMVVACVAALVRGRWEERLLGATYLAACMASLAVEKRPWTGPQGAVIAIDAIVLALAIGVVLGSRKLWPVIAAAFQVLTVGAHLAFIGAEGRLGAAGYLTVLAVWSYGMVGCLAWGAGSQLPLPERLRPRSLRKGYEVHGAPAAPAAPARAEPVDRRCDDGAP